MINRIKGKLTSILHPTFELTDAEAEKLIQEYPDCMDDDSEEEIESIIYTD